MNKLKKDHKDFYDFFIIYNVFFFVSFVWSVINSMIVFISDNWSYLLIFTKNTPDWYYIFSVIFLLVLQAITLIFLVMCYIKYAKLNTNKRKPIILCSLFIVSLAIIITFNLCNLAIVIINHLHLIPITTIDAHLNYDIRLGFELFNVIALVLSILTILYFKRYKRRLLNKKTQTNQKEKYNK